MVVATAQVLQVMEPADRIAIDEIQVAVGVEIAGDDRRHDRRAAARVARCRIGVGILASFRDGPGWTRKTMAVEVP